MLILLDTANTEEIRQYADIFPLDGVTVNPSIIARNPKSFYPLLFEIQEIIGKDTMLHVQAVGLSSEEIVAEARYMNKKLGGMLFVKIPVVQQGIKAIKILSAEGIRTTATAVYTPQQALIAGKAGAAFVAPYVSRLDNIGAHGVFTVRDIMAIINKHHLSTKVIAASFKTVEQVNSVCVEGAHGVTVSAEILRDMLHYPLTDLSVSSFLKDWETRYGIGNKTYDLE